MWWDITGFLHGINFLVLASGIYGIGELLGTTAGTSKSQLFKARGKMRVLLRDLDSSENPGLEDDGKEMEAWSI